MSLAEPCRRRLSTSLNYGRYPVYPWAKLPQSVQYMICTRILPTALPSFVLVTEDGGQSTSGPSWRRVLLSSVSENPEEISPEQTRIVASPNPPVGTADRPRMLAVSASQLEMAMNAQTRLTFKSPSTVEISIYLPETESSALLLNSTEDIQSPRSWEPFLWQCGLCVAQFTISDEHSMELVAAHLRLHLELRFCLKCNTVLPNSALAVDAPDAKPHRCKDLVTPVDLNIRHQPHNQESILFEPQHGSEESTQNPWRRYCQICRRGFSSPAQYSQHLKNVHKNKRFLCPDCGTSFSTKGNMTTHFQQVHNLSDSVSCPLCSKRCSNRYNLRRHISLVHAIKQRNPDHSSDTEGNAERNTTDHTDLSSDADQSATITLTTAPTTGRSRGYYLYMAPQKKTPEAAEPSGGLGAPTSEVLQANKEQTDAGGQQVSEPSLVAEVSIVRSRRYAPIVSVQLSPAGSSKEIRLLQPLDGKPELD
nr:unnamed protein product [Spirometra erinaceieuropaei]